MLAALSLLSQGACSPSREDEAAHLFAALLKSVEIPASGSGELPSKVSCGKSVYDLTNGGEVTSTNAAVVGATVTGTFDMRVDAKGDSIFSEGGGTDDPSFVCIAAVQVGYTASALRVSLPITISTCDGFDCTVNGVRIACETMKTKLASLTCE